MILGFVRVSSGIRWTGMGGWDVDHGDGVGRGLCLHVHLDVGCVDLSLSHIAMGPRDISHTKSHSYVVPACLELGRAS